MIRFVNELAIRRCSETEVVLLLTENWIGLGSLDSHRVPFPQLCDLNDSPHLDVVNDLGRCRLTQPKKPQRTGDA